MTALAAVDAITGPSAHLAGLLSVGPCLAAISGRPRTVLVVGGYCMALLALLSWPDELWGSREQLFFLLALIAVTGASAFAAQRRRRHEPDLRLAEVERLRAIAVSQATSEFLGRVSHELRTPLNSVLGFTELLQREDLTPDQRETTNQISRAGKHLLDLVNDVLDVTATETRQLSLSVEAIAVDEVVAAAIELTASQAQTHEITVSADLGESDAWYVRADARRIRQILVNLVSNAIKFNRPGGSVTLSAERDGVGGISISVSDTGPGIAAEDLPKLFRPFERLNAHLSGIEGSGLGLALSRGLAVAMGGTLTVAATAGAGATFTVTLPETTAPDSAFLPTDQHPPIAIPAPDGAAGLARVLYIEDNLSNLRLVQRILGFRPAWAMTHAATGLEGLEAAASDEQFDLVLLDQNLPDMHGLEVLRELRKNPELAEVPVVIVSADAAPGHLSRAQQAGATDYLVKPFTIDGLIAVLDAYQPLADRSES